MAAFETGGLYLSGKVLMRKFILGLSMSI